MSSGLQSGLQSERDAPMLLRIEGCLSSDKDLLFGGTT